MKDGYSRVVVKGKTYDFREELKSAGFRWDSEDRKWFRIAEDAEVDGIFEVVEALGLECEFDEE